MQVRLRLRREQKRQIQRPADQIGTHLRGIIRLDIKRRLRQCGAELAHPVADMMIRQIALQPDPQGHGAAARPGGILQRLGPALAQRPRMRLESQPLGRQPRARAGPMKQPTPQRRLQRPHPPRNGGLCHPQPIRRAVEAARLAQVQKGFQKLGLHHRT